MDDEEPAWKDAARFAAKIWRHPKTHSSLFIFACTCALSAAALHSGTYYTPTCDVIVYCLIYSLWLTICLPWLVKYLDKKTVVLVLGVLGRLFAAEAGVLLWGLLRGHGYFLQRVLRLKPLLEPSLLWLAEAGYNLRYGVVVAASVAAILATLTNLIDSNNRRQRNGDIIVPNVEDRDQTNAWPQLKLPKQDDYADKRQDSASSERTFLADRSPPPEFCKHGHLESQEPTPILHGINSLLSFSLPTWKKQSSREHMNFGTRNSSGDRSSVGTQKNWSQTLDKLNSRKTQHNDNWIGFSSSNTSQGKVESFVRTVGKRNRVQKNELPPKGKYRGFIPRTPDDIDINPQSSLPANISSSSAAKAKPKLRPSSSCASSVSTGRDLRKYGRTRRGQRLGRGPYIKEAIGSPGRRLTRDKMSRGESRSHAVYLEPESD